MNRKAFLLGFYSIGGQVLLLRELESSLNGDELFIGTALFGWLLSVALGAYLGGKRHRPISSKSIFGFGALLLPAMIIVTRLLPLSMVAVVGEIIAFSTAALVSALLMFPVGILSGCLFSIITTEGHRPAESIVQVYLFEGLGSFVGGLAVVILVGSLYSTLGMAAILGCLVLAIAFLPIRGGKIALPIIALLVISIIVKLTLPRFDSFLDSIKYKSYRVDASFDTPYGHQTILTRDSSLALITDNSVEASFPDLLTAENLLLPPLLYRPASRNILYIGRAELGIAQLASNLPYLKITALDSRAALSQALDRAVPDRGNIIRIDNDPVSFFSRSAIIDRYDIIIINPGEPNNYKNSRLLTDKFLNAAQIFLNDGGIIYYPSRYDTDRHISSEKAEIISTIYNTFKKSLKYAEIWPGDMTAIFGSNDSIFDIPVDSLIERTTVLTYPPQFINEAYLPDRLQNLKIERLKDALESSSKINSINRPALPYQQAIYHSQTGDIDKKLVPALYENRLWIGAIPLAIVLFYISMLIGKRKRRSYGLFLYFIAGLVSLSLELVSFYIYQSSAGSLYSEMGALIGAFMLGLALGAYYSIKIGKEHQEYPALFLLLAAVILFMATYYRIVPLALIYYHLFFLFTAAIATGSLFVAATGRYYFGKANANRGVGYALEIIGSSLGALLPTTILLPIIGLQWILAAIIILIILALVGAYISG
jgi:spermidine synthase